MKKYLLLGLLFTLGCDYENHMLIREPSILQENLSGKKNHLFRKSSYWELARAVQKNYPPSNTLIERSGSVTFTGKSYQFSYHFTFSYISPSNWNLKLYNSKDNNLYLALHKNNLGLTYENILDQTFFQGQDHLIWSKLNQHLWQNKLKRVTESLLPPKFDSSLAWLEEVDGLKYYVISRVGSVKEHHRKFEVYLHKKSKSLSRRITNSYQAILEDQNFLKYKEIGNYYFPTKIYIKYPTRSERLDLNIKNTNLVLNYKPKKSLKDI